MVGNNQSVDFNGRVLVVANRRQRRAIVGVKKEVFKKLLYFLGRGVNRVVFQVEEEAFLCWVLGRG